VQLSCSNLIHFRKRRLHTLPLPRTAVARTKINGDVVICCDATGENSLLAVELRWTLVRGGRIVTRASVFEGFAMDMGLLINLISGAVGGNVAGKAVKSLDMGTLWNSVAGIVGGGLGGQILGQLGLDPGAAAAAATDSGGLGAIVSQIGGGGVGGAVLLLIAGYVKKMMAKG
jgi:uncharacterized membrane protein YeaQ/YmgE (transglycosylase-associated protein family)